MKAMLLTQAANVATALSKIDPDDAVELVLNGVAFGTPFKALEAIPFGFKICAKPMRKGQDVIKYGHVIGRASCDIAVGSLVHVHNIEGCRGRGDLNQ